MEMLSSSTHAAQVALVLLCVADIAQAKSHPIASHPIACRASEPALVPPGQALLVSEMLILLDG